MVLSDQARSFNRMLLDFVEETPGVEEAIAVSSDGLLLASSAGRDRENIEQFAAIVSGLTSLAKGAASCFRYDHVEQLIVEMSGGFVFVTSVGDGSIVGVLAERSCDIGLVGYEMTILLNRVGRALTPELVSELKNLLAA